MDSFSLSFFCLLMNDFTMSMRRESGVTSSTTFKNSGTLNVVSTTYLNNWLFCEMSIYYMKVFRSYGYDLMIPWSLWYSYWTCQVLNSWLFSINLVRKFQIFSFVHISIVLLLLFNHFDMLYMYCTITSVIPTFIVLIYVLQLVYCLANKNSIWQL